MLAKDEVLERVVERVAGQFAGDQAHEVGEFVRQYYTWVPEEDLAGRSPVDVYGAAISHYNFLKHRRPGESKVHVYNPHHEQDGWQSTHTVVEIATDDMPFLVDSVGVELGRLGHGIRLMFHPIFEVRRDGEGNLTKLLPPDSGDGDSIRESVIHVEVERRTEPGVLDELRKSLEQVLSEVRAAVTDWNAMKDRVSEIASELRDSPPSTVVPEEADETANFLEWLVEDHFTFTGYREYELVEEEGEDVLRAVPDSGLGILRRSGNNSAGGQEISQSFQRLSPEARRLAREPIPLNLTKTNAASRVHRPSHLDYIGVKKFDVEGNVVGERRFLGLYTSAAYWAEPLDIPLVREKVRAILDGASFPDHSHYEKSLLEVFETYPRDQLIQTPLDELRRISLGMLRLQERQRVKAFIRRDTFGRFVSCFVFVPRDRYDTEARVRIRNLLESRFSARSIDFSVRLSESVLARLLFVIYADPEDTEDYDLGEIESAVSLATHTWTDDLYESLVEGFGEERGTTLFYRYREAFPAGYKEEFLARRAYPDIDHMESLEEDGDLGMSLYRRLEEPENHLRFKLFRKGRIVSLSEVLPLLEHMGVTVVDEIGPFEVRPVCNHDSTDRYWVHDFGLRAERSLDTGEVRGVFQEVFRRVWDYEVEDDGFNRLVLRAGLDSREITVLRSVCKYLRQTNLTFSQSYMESTLDRNPHLARLLVRLFKSRFDPRRQGQDNSRAEAATESLVGQIESALDDVASLDEDRIIRSFLNVVLAMRRTNFYRTDDGGNPLPYLSFKLEPGELPELPEPRPKFEVFVYSPRMEGVHLRGGDVARGGIRWSDRREDFRTEVLGLMKAQMVKNAVIVPVGAKGGFVVKQPPVNADRETIRREVIHCYETLIRGMLDVTDNLSAGGEVVPPADVVRLDGDDPYLVVAADKGTATFSDIANGVSGEYGFWLGDAFASGGSVGYDHKAMGITAKGAWESVRRHFRELGLDTQAEDFTTVGIGDMSGDVFGNGMLLSRHIKLVGAFNHLHIFLDPDPDPEAGYAERERLFALPRSTWADYDGSLISEGGGVFSRAAKSVPLSRQVKELLGLGEDHLTPNELMGAMLRAEVDLLWNGGIGTYVKSSSEANSAVGDRANDALRVDGRDLGCRVVGEGGNLGMTQLGRIEYALVRGGRVYMDAVDNSAGVDCSDHEVNIKVLLDSIVSSGDMTGKQRDELLASMTDEVGRHVLRDNYLQTQALSNESYRAAELADLHARYVAYLGSSGKLDRGLEFLPSEAEISDRKSEGGGLAAPELAVVLSYTKLTLYQRLLGSDALDDEYLADEMVRYFPKVLGERFEGRMLGHRLRGEIVATSVVNSLVNRCGTTFAFRMGEETGAGFPEIARAYTAVREVFDLKDLWSEIEALDNRVSSATQTRMYLACTKLAERTTRWFLRNQRSHLDIGEAVERFSPVAKRLTEDISGIISERDRETLDANTRALTDEDVPEGLAAHISLLDLLYATLDIVDLAGKTGEGADTTACIYLTIGDRMNLRWLRDHIEKLPKDNRWRTLARAALRDDLYSLQATMTEEIMSATDLDLPPEERIEAWADENRRAVDRTIQVLRDVNQSGVYDLATLPVMLRELRNLTGSATRA